MRLLFAAGFAGQTGIPAFPPIPKVPARNGLRRSRLKVRTSRSSAALIEGTARPSAGLSGRKGRNKIVGQYCRQFNRRADHSSIGPTITRRCPAQDHACSWFARHSLSASRRSGRQRRRLFMTGTSSSMPVSGSISFSIQVLAKVTRTPLSPLRTCRRVPAPGGRSSRRAAVFGRCAPEASDIGWVTSR